MIINYSLWRIVSATVSWEDLTQKFRNFLGNAVSSSVSGRKLAYTRILGTAVYDNWLLIFSRLSAVVNIVNQVSAVEEQNNSILSTGRSSTEPVKAQF